MNSLEKFKLELQNEGFKKKFSEIKNLDEALKIAKDNGFDLNKDEVLNDNELSEDMMDAVAGGAKIKQSEDKFLVVSGNDSYIYKGGQQNPVEE